MWKISRFQLKILTDWFCNVKSSNSNIVKKLESMENSLNIILQRYSDDKNSTLGMMFVDNKFYCYTLEDEYREVKVKGETRIPAGRYELILNKVLTPLTQKYRKKYKFFKYHIQLKDVPLFNNIYIHVGNYDENTDGCILVGDSANNNQFEKGMISHSFRAFERFYTLVYPTLEQGNKKVFINIRNEKNIKA